MKRIKNLRPEAADEFLKGQHKVYDMVLTMWGKMCEVDEVLEEMKANMKPDAPDVPDTPDEPDEPTPPAEDVIEYGDVNVTLTYDAMSWDATTIRPKSMLYNQPWTKNGEAQTPIATGGVVTYSGDGVDEETGEVTASVNETNAERTVAVVTVNVTLNGKTGSKTVEVKQDGKALYWYYGTMNGTRTTFAALDNDAIMSGVTSLNSAKQKKADKTVEDGKNIFYIVVPDGVTIKGATMTSGGITTTWTAGEVANWDITHDDIVVDGVTMKVRGYRNTSLAGARMIVNIN